MAGTGNRCALLIGAGSNFIAADIRAQFLFHGVDDIAGHLWGEDAEIVG